MTDTTKSLNDSLSGFNVWWEKQEHGMYRRDIDPYEIAKEAWECGAAMAGTYSDFLIEQTAKIIARDAGHGAWEEWVPEAEEIAVLYRKHQAAQGDTVEKLVDELASCMCGRGSEAYFKFKKNKLAAMNMGVVIGKTDEASNASCDAPPTTPASMGEGRVDNSGSVATSPASYTKSSVSILTADQNIESKSMGEGAPTNATKSSGAGCGENSATASPANIVVFNGIMGQAGHACGTTTFPDRFIKGDASNRKDEDVGVSTAAMPETVGKSSANHFVAPHKMVPSEISDTAEIKWVLKGIPHCRPTDDDLLRELQDRGVSSHSFRCIGCNGVGWTVGTRDGVTPEQVPCERCYGTGNAPKPVAAGEIRTTGILGVPGACCGTTSFPQTLGPPPTPEQSLKWLNDIDLEKVDHGDNGKWLKHLIVRYRELCSPKPVMVDLHAGALAIRDFQETIGYDALRMAEACAQTWRLKYVD